MNIEIESKPGVVSLTIVSESKRGNPIVLRFVRWSKENPPHLDCFSEHFEGEETECQYRTEGWCCCQDVEPGRRALMLAVRDAQDMLGLTLHQIVPFLLRKYSNEPWHFAAILHFQIQDFLAMEIEGES